MSITIAGVDDAGRGSVIGPLVIAGVLMDEPDLPILIDIGVKDSKVLSSGRREKLALEIRKLALRCHVEMLPPAEIDKAVRSQKRLHKLNRLEAHTMAKVIAKLRPHTAYVDASDVLADRFKRIISESLPFKVHIISEHKADAKYPIVSAASIIAKVERDKTISRLQEECGDVGSGYPSDPKTLKFLEKWIRKFRYYPDFVRKSWKTAKRFKVRTEEKQKKLA